MTRWESGLNHSGRRFQSKNIKNREVQGGHDSMQEPSQRRESDDRGGKKLDGGGGSLSGWTGWRRHVLGVSMGGKVAVKSQSEGKGGQHTRKVRGR